MNTFPKKVVHLMQLDEALLVIRGLAEVGIQLCPIKLPAPV